MKVVIEKILNNNAVISLGEEQAEIIVMGRGGSVWQKAGRFDRPEPDRKSIYFKK